MRTALPVDHQLASPWMNWTVKHIYIRIFVRSIFPIRTEIAFAWSSLPLICQSIAFDVENGIGHAQFATHLLMHVHPYFFHQLSKLKRAEHGGLDSLADRLMTPELGHRVIESIFENSPNILETDGAF